MQLQQPSESLRTAYQDFVEEWTAHQERVIPYSASPREMTFDELLVSWCEEKTELAYKRNFVPSELFFLVHDSRILGAIHLRYELNDHLKQIGGHIGYGVRPCERRKGYVMKMMSLIMKEVKKHQIKRLLLTCDDDNVASAKAIEKCGGVLEGVTEFEGKLIRKYWIDVID